MGQDADKVITALLLDLQPLDLILETFQLSFKIRSVTEDLSESQQLAVLVAKRLQHAGRPEPDAVFAKHPAIVFGRGAARGNLEFAQRNAFGGVLGRKEHAKRLSQDLFGGVAEDDFRTRQPGRDATFRVQKKERVLAGIGKKYVK
jgi:hypothetical protein